MNSVQRSRSSSNDTSCSQRSRSNSIQSTSSAGSGGGGGWRWWRWRSNRVTATPPEAEQLSWGQRLECLCSQLSPVLPLLSSATGKAIVLLVLLVLGWKLLIWALEVVITLFCCFIALCILLSFIRPDIAFKIATEVLPPRINQARLWLSKFLLEAGESLRGRPLNRTSDPDLAHPSAPTPRRTRSIHSYPRARSEGSVIYSTA